MEAVCLKCQTPISQFKDNKALQYHKMCDTCRTRKTNIDVDCSSCDKFNQLITQLHEPIEKINNS